MLQSKIDTYRIHRGLLIDIHRGLLIDIHRGLLIDIHRGLSDQQLTLTLPPNMGSLGKQFKHIGRVQLGYVDALNTGRLNFWKPLGNPSLETSKSTLLSFLETNDRELLRLLQELTETQLLSTRVEGSGKAHQSNNQLSVYDLLDDIRFGVPRKLETLGDWFSEEAASLLTEQSRTFKSFLQGELRFLTCRSMDSAAKGTGS